MVHLSNPVPSSMVKAETPTNTADTQTNQANNQTNKVDDAYSAVENQLMQKINKWLHEKFKSISFDYSGKDVQTAMQYTPHTERTYVPLWNQFLFKMLWGRGYQSLLAWWTYVSFQRFKCLLIFEYVYTVELYTIRKEEILFKLAVIGNHCFNCGLCI